MRDGFCFFFRSEVPERAIQALPKERSLKDDFEEAVENCS
jgi:hypothetical protein